MKQLENDFAKCPLIVSEPVVTYKETIKSESKQMCLAKSANKLNRIFGKMSPLGDELTNDIENGVIAFDLDNKVLQ